MAVPPFEKDEIAALPAEIQAELEILDRFREHQFTVHGTDYTPCSWLDHVTRKCKHHDIRPGVCRDFEVGNVHCVSLRRDAKLD